MNCKIKIVWSEIDLTPDKKISLAGQFAERISEYVEKPITATAMAVSSEDAQVIIVSCDLAAVSANLVDLVRGELVGNTAGIDPNMVIMSAIHTHTGPEFPLARRNNVKTGSKSLLIDLLPEGKKYVERQNVSENPNVIRGDEMLHYLAEKLTKVIFDAWEDRKPGSFTNAFGRATVGMCRRVTYSDGSAQMWGETNQAVFEAIEGGSDTGIELLYVYDENGKIKGIVPNLACPAQCVQHRMFVSPYIFAYFKKVYLFP